MDTCRASSQSNPHPPSTILQGFRKLSKAAYFYEPALSPSPSIAPSSPPLPAASAPESLSQNGQTPRRLLVLCAWYGARLDHVDKYTSKYRAIYPTASILVLTFVPSGLVDRRDSERRRNLLPALLKVQQFIAGGVPQHGQGCCDMQARRNEVTLHMFSNAGIYTACQLADLANAELGHPIPLHALIFDSCPGHGSYSRMAKPMLVNLPRAPYLYLPGMLAVHGFVSVFALLEQFGFENVVERGFRRSNEDADLSGKDVPRLYLYSKEDEIVGWRDVEEHAEIARRRGCVVRMVLFRDSAHVAHARGDGDKYWYAVRQMIERDTRLDGSITTSPSESEKARL